jgi:hypothetical protein
MHIESGRINSAFDRERMAINVETEFQVAYRSSHTRDSQVPDVCRPSVAFDFEG